MRILIIATAVLLGACAGQSKKEAATTAANTPSAPAKTEAKATAKANAKVQAVTSSASATEGTVTCKAGEVTREIKVVRSAERCTVEYSKDGATNEVATGALSSSHCNDVAEKIKTNLANAGYSCQ